MYHNGHLFWIITKDRKIIRPYISKQQSISFDPQLGRVKNGIFKSKNNTYYNDWYDDSWDYNYNNTSYSNNYNSNNRNWRRKNWSSNSKFSTNKNSNNTQTSQSKEIKRFPARIDDRNLNKNWLLGRSTYKQELLLYFNAKLRNNIKISRRLFFRNKYIKRKTRGFGFVSGQFVFTCPCGDFLVSDHHHCKNYFSADQYQRSFAFISATMSSLKHKIKNSCLKYALSNITDYSSLCTSFFINTILIYGYQYCKSHYQVLYPSDTHFYKFFKRIELYESNSLIFFGKKQQLHTGSMKIDGSLK